MSPKGVEIENRTRRFRGTTFEHWEESQKCEEVEERRQFFDTQPVHVGRRVETVERRGEFPFEDFQS